MSKLKPKLIEKETLEIENKSDLSRKKRLVLSSPDVNIVKKHYIDNNGSISNVDNVELNDSKIDSDSIVDSSITIESHKTMKLKADDGKIKKIQVKKQDESKKPKTKKEFLANHDLMILEVVKIIMINETTRIYRLTPSDKSKLPTFKSCQYLEIKTKFNNQLYSRNFSICSSPSEAELNNYYEIIVQNERRSIVSSKLFSKWKVGSRVIASKPTGNFYFWKKFDKPNICAIIHGLGAAPILSLAKTVSEGNEDIHLYIFNFGKRMKDLLFTNEFKELANSSSKIKLINVLSNENVPGSEFGVIDEIMINKYCDIRDATLYVCGSKKVCSFIINNMK